MECVIWKYPLETEKEFSLEMPRNAHLLSVQMQGETACLWALVAPEAATERRQFRWVATGEPHSLDPLFLPDLLRRYVGTVQPPGTGTGLAFHLFDATP